MRLSDETPSFQPPAELLTLAETLESRGFEAWAVGGAIRDELLGHPRGDWDLATAARPEDVQRVFRHTVPIGVEHGTVGVVASDRTLYEITTFRRDIETDGRHAVVEFADSIEDDLARRDFTINAMAWRPATDAFLDPWEGRRDLERGILRAVGDPELRLAEDYLRVLRGLRFAGRLELEIESRTLAAIEAAVASTATLSAERVREELEKVLTAERPSATLRLYGSTGILEIWYPELAGAPADPRWELSLAAVDAVPAHRALLRLVRWMLAADVAANGDAATEAAGEARAAGGRALMERLRFSNADGKRVLHLLRWYQPLVSPTDSSAQLRSWLADVTADSVRDIFRLHFADARATNAQEKKRYLCHLWRRVHEEIIQAPPLTVGDLAIGGEELLELGIEQGPAVGLILDELHARVLEDPTLNEPGRLTHLAGELAHLGELKRGERPEDPS